MKKLLLLSAVSLSNLAHAHDGRTDEGHRFGVIELQATGFAALGQQTGREDQELVFFAGREFHVDLLLKAN